MPVDTNKIIAGSAFSGFKNYTVASGLGDIDSFLSLSPNTAVVIGAGSFVGPIPAVIALNNSNAISEIQIQYVSIDSFTRVLPGVVVVDYPSAAAPQYQIQSYSYFTGGNLHVDTIVSNQTAGNVTVPAFTISVHAFLFVAPF